MFVHIPLESALPVLSQCQTIEPIIISSCWEENIFFHHQEIYGEIIVVENLPISSKFIANVSFALRVVIIITLDSQA